MHWLVDIDGAVSDGTVTAAGGAELKRRAREAMVSYAVNLALFAGILMVVGGAATWLEDRLALAALGAALTGVGTVALVCGGPRVLLLANATAIIGATLAVSAGASLLFEDRADRLAVGAALGLPIAALGWILRRVSPTSLSVVGGWLFLLGVGVHLFGVLTTESDLGLEWLALHYAGLAAIVCGTLLDVRFVTACAIVPLAAALSSRTFYGHASYGVAIYEVTLTILQMGVIAALALAISLRSRERIARHARILGQLALIWINMALWIGSLWGDVIGSHLWGPRWEAITAGIDDPSAREEAWRAAVDSFDATALALPAEVFAAIWALAILAVGAWAAASGRRAVLNIAVAFGAIHFYTQYFERLEITPVAFVIAGVIAILAAWALWSFNRRIASG